MAYGQPWSDHENDLIVADYFVMLDADLAGDRLSKAERNRQLQSHIDRNHKAIEFKHQNISAVLMGMGEPWLTGYPPATNFQASLVDAVLRWFRGQRTWAPETLKLRSARYLNENRSLWIGPPPTQSNTPPREDLDRLNRVADLCDAARRDERNRTLGRAGEELVLDHERAGLEAAGRPDLANAVRWVSESDGDGLGYDIASFDSEGRSRLIEVKTTNGWDRTPFHISRNELRVAEIERETWHLIRVWNFARDPKAFAIRPPLEAYVELTPTSFLASLH